MTTVCVAIPSIPPRSAMLAEALASVCAQTRVPDEISVAVDHHRQGAATTRNRAWRATTSEYIGFLDDDDRLGPVHLERLLATAAETGADLVYPGFTVVGGSDPMPWVFGQPWDPANPVQTTITVLWRREALEAVGGFPEPGPDWQDSRDPHGNRAGEDYEAVLRLNAAGGKIMHLPERTWEWVHHSANTMGLASRW